MRKLTGILFLFFAFIFVSQAQVRLIAEDGSADKGDTLKIKVRAVRFNDILGFDYRQSFDTTAFRFIDIVDKHKDIVSMTFFGPKQMAQPDNFISLSWFEPTSNTITLPDTADLYTMRFIAQGNPGDKDSIRFTARSEIEIIDIDNELLPFTIDNGLMTINGGNTGGDEKLKVFLSEKTGDKGQQKCLDLSVEDFTDILDFQLAFKWDKTVATFANVQDFNLKDLSAGNFAIHPTSKELRVTWSENSGTPITLNGKTKIASICYDLTGNAGSSTPVQIANDGSFVLEASNDDGDDVEIEVHHGKLTINQGSMGGGNFTFIASKNKADKNTDVCVDVSVKSFTNIAGMEFDMAWDNTILKNANIKNVNLKYMDENNSFQLKDGSLSCSWGDANGVTVSDNTVIFELCFTTTARCESISSIIFKGSRNNDIELFDIDDNDVLPIDLVSGEVEIECDGGGGGDDFDLTIKSGTVEEDKEVCVAMDVKNFTDIEGMQFSLVWNPSIIMFTRITNINVPGFNASSYSENPVGTLRVAFSPVNPVTIADGTMFEVCYTGLDCDKSSNLTFSNVPLPIEATNSASKDLTVVTHNGSINVTCKSIEDLKVELQGKRDVKCRDDENGSIGVKATGAAGYKYQWYKNGVLIPGGTKSGLMDIGPGEYYVVVTDANDATRTVTLNPRVTLQNPPLLVVSEIANSRDDGTCNGSAEVKATGGWGNYSYVWKSTPQPQQRGPKLENVCKGDMHIVRITDEGQCSVEDTITIFGPEIEHNASNTTLKCNGDCDVELKVAPEGGCKPYTYNWSGTGTDKTAQNQSGLCAGNYAVTISDVLGDEEVVTFTILAPPAILIVLNGSIIHGPNGQINVTVTGGEPSLFYVWRDKDGNEISRSQNLTGANPGTYTLTVTDDNGCTKTFTGTIKDNPPGDLEVTDNTTDVTCNGENDGEIDLEVKNGDDCFIVWDHDPNLEEYKATGLSAGEYKVTFIDQDGNDKWTKTYTILEPDVLSVSVVKVFCSTGDDVKNGSYEAIVTGGTPNYTYEWCNKETTAKAVRLSGGNSCDVLVKDANGCQAFYEDIEVCSDSMGVPPSDCYEGRKVITPNEDGRNDYLLITCDNDFPNKLSVFDRWGRLVFEQIDYNSTNGLGWTGVDVNGTALNEGGYMWVLRVDLPNGDQRLYRGTVILAR